MSGVSDTGYASPAGEELDFVLVFQTNSYYLFLLLSHTISYELRISMSVIWAAWEKQHDAIHRAGT